MPAEVNITHELTFMYPNTILPRNPVRTDTRQHLLLLLSVLSILSVYLHLIMTPLLPKLPALLPLALLLLSLHPRLLHLPLLLRAELRIPFLRQLPHTAVAY